MGSNYKFVGRKIQKLIPEVKKRNRNALLFSGGESVLMYVPVGYNDDSEYDNVRGTYRTQDVKYQLILNNQYFGCERLYGNDTDTYPSVRMAFPSNPESLSHREEGFGLLNRNNAWTLWYPILPTKGVLIIRKTPFIGELDSLKDGRELYLLENVTHSYFPINNGSGLHLLHQETPVSRVEDGIPVKISDLPTVEDTLAVYKNDLEYNLNGFSVLGSYSVSDIGTTFSAGFTLTTDENYLNNKVKFDTTFLQPSGVFDLTLGKWNDNSTPCVHIDRSLGTISLMFNGLNTIKQINYPLATNQKYNFRAEIDNGKLKFWVDQSLVVEVNLFVYSLYTTFQPLTSNPIIISSSVDVLLHNFYVMDLI